MATPINGIYVLQGIVPSEIAAAPVTAKVVEIYDDSGNLFSAAQVAQMASGGGQVLGYFSIGEAEEYRSYFSSLPSSVVGPVDPSWPGNYEVAYWTPQWLTVAKNYIQTMINQGYQGAYFDVVGEATEAWAQKNAPNGDPEGAMVKLIQDLASFARAQNPNFKIWINSSGAEPLLTNSALINTIDGVFEEELFYQSATKATGAADLNYNIGLLNNVTNAGKPVIAIEYVSGATQVASVEAQAKADGFGYYIANPNLDLNGVDTQGFAGLTPPTPPAAVPKVTITSAAETSAQATQIIAGTVVGGVANSTVNILDGGSQIGTATLKADGTWSTSVTLHQGANLLTATYTSAAGTGTSNAITDTLTSSTPPAVPKVTITSAAETSAQATQIIAGTVVGGVANSTVNILDGGAQIGTATLKADGTWSTSVTLHQGANLLTATYTNAAGTGTSNAITDTLTSPTTPPTNSTLPTLTIDNSTLHVTGGGGTVALGIHETAPSSATSASITIKGLPWYETITDGLGDTFSGGQRVRITAEQVASGLTLTSNYQGTRHPVANLQITANATVGGVTTHSATQTLTVIDPPATSTATTGKLALLNQYIASGFDHHSGGAPLMSNVASAFGHDDSVLTSPRHA